MLWTVLLVATSRPIWSSGSIKMVGRRVGNGGGGVKGTPVLGACTSYNIFVGGHKKATYWAPNFLLPALSTVIETEWNGVSCFRARMA